MTASERKLDPNAAILMTDAAACVLVPHLSCHKTPLYLRDIVVIVTMNV